VSGDRFDVMPNITHPTAHGALYYSISAGPTNYLHNVFWCAYSAANECLALQTTAQQADNVTEWAASVTSTAIPTPTPTPSIRNCYWGLTYHPELNACCLIGGLICVAPH